MDYDFIRPGLSRYIYERIVPEYAGFDPAHREDHAIAVIDNSIKLYLTAPDNIRVGINPEILFTAAACHDLGRINGKENHHIDSGKIIRADSNLTQWFDEEQIGLIAEAAEDHRASNGNEPRSIYGKIVAEADRLIDPETIIRRTLQYGLYNYPELDIPGQIERAIKHLNNKYGANGYLKLWIPWSDNARRLSELRNLLADPAATRAEIRRQLSDYKISSNTAG